MHSEILMMLVSNYLVCNYLYVIKLASRQSAAFIKEIPDNLICFEKCASIVI